MKFIDEYRDPALARRLRRAIEEETRGDWRIMEVCGGQTHAIVRFGIDELLPPRIRLLHGPGCPVCVTPLEVLDLAIDLAARPDVVLCSFGDMLRVPGSSGTLAGARARGASLRVIYSPLDAVDLAETLPGSEVVLLAVGFETTAPATAMAILEARRRNLRNFSALVSHVLVPPALEALLCDEDSGIDAFLAAGHVCTVMGTSEYEPIAARHRVPIVVTGFEPIDILDGILRCVRQLEDGRAEVENQYARAVRAEGNPGARRALAEVFRVASRPWRGMGEIPGGGLALAPDFASYDAERRFGLARPVTEQEGECISGLVLRGQRRPDECPAFHTRCTPEHPLGATMVSSEGACAAYSRYRTPA